MQGNPPEWWFKCNDPNCFYTAPRSLILGKTSLCPQCHIHELILDKEAMRRAVPRCINCRETKEAKAYKAAKNLIEQIGIENMEKAYEELGNPNNPFIGALTEAFGDKVEDREEEEVDEIDSPL